jgi:purine-binding chemotaxis protein CheW
MQMNAEADQRAQFLTFKLGEDVFAIEIAPIREILEYPNITTIPLTPAFVRGVMNVRGNVVPVIDLALRLGNQRTEIARRTCVVIVEVAVATDKPMHIGLLVDAVNEVLDVERKQIEPKPSFGLGIRAEFVAGMLRSAQGFVVVLEPDEVLSNAELGQVIDLGNADKLAASAAA